MAEKKFKVHIQLEQNQLLKAAVENSASAPSTPVAGQIYFDTTLNQFGVYNGTKWVYLGDITTIEWQDSALDYITDNTLVPPTEVTGDRYVLSHDGGAPNAAWDGASVGDIVEFNGTTWDAHTPTTGTMISIDDESDVLYYWGGSAWTTKSFEATTASNGVKKVSLDIQLDLNSLTGEVIDIVNDSIAFIDNSDSDNTKKESTADFIAAMAGDGLTQNGTTKVLDVDDASTTQKGKAELATPTETKARADSTRVVTPAGLASFPVRHADDFVVADWAGAGPYTLTYSSGTHGVGASKNLTAKVYEDGTPNEEVEVNITVSDAGEVVVNSNSTFDGHILIDGTA